MTKRILNSLGQPYGTLLTCVSGVLKQANEQREKRPVLHALTIETPVDVVCEHRQLTKALLLSPARQSPITHARGLIAHIGFHTLRLKGVDIARAVNLSPAAVSTLAVRGTGDPAKEEIM
jgi:hypothetical protein